MPVGNAAVKCHHQRSGSRIWIWSFAGEQGHFLHRRHHAGPRDVHPDRFRCDVERCGWNAGECQRRTVCRRGIGQRPTVYSMAWNGSAVTLWSAAGFNSFNWWPFSDLVEPPKASCLASEQDLQGRSMMSTRPLSGLAASTHGRENKCQASGSPQFNPRACVAVASGPRSCRCGRPPLASPEPRIIHFAGTSRFSSSNQLSTTLSSRTSGCTAFSTNRNRLPSGNTA